MKSYTTFHLTQPNRQYKEEQHVTTLEQISCQVAYF